MTLIGEKAGSGGIRTGLSSKDRATTKSPVLADEGTARTALASALREYGIAQANGNASPWWSSCADAAIAFLAAGDVPFSADHVNELIPEADHPCRLGARFHIAVRTGLVRPVGYVLSDRPSRRRGVLRLYRGGRGRG